MGNKKLHKRTRKPRSRIREMACPDGMEGYPYMVLLTPQWWGGSSPTHDEMIEVARSWGPCRVLATRKRVSQRTRIYFPNESQLLMFRVAFGERIWKLYRLVT